MPLNPNFIERQLFFRFNKAPGPMLDMLSVVAFYAIATAAELEIFEILADEARSSEALAQHINIDQEGAIILLDVLEGLGYVRRKQKNGLVIFANSPMASEWMISTAKVNFAEGFKFFKVMASQFLPQLGASIQQGQPQRHLYEWLADQPEPSKIFQDWLAAGARLAKEEVSTKLTIQKENARILDLGGGHGVYSTTICRQYPDVTVTIYDSELALKMATDQIMQEDLASRISIQAGDFIADDIGSDYDMVLLFNVIHGLTDDQIISLFERVKSALIPGGRIAILEQLSGQGPTKLVKTGISLFSLLYYHNLGGKVLRFEEINALLLEGGFSEVKETKLKSVRGASLILAS
jgi:2-polyprenyl-3-methyl-5-hydroxy-6-metoxy-1,4-benzoquinol methylase